VLYFYHVLELVPVVEHLADVSFVHIVHFWAAFVFATRHSLTKHSHIILDTVADIAAGFFFACVLPHSYSARTHSHHNLTHNYVLLYFFADPFPGTMTETNVDRPTCRQILYFTTVSRLIKFYCTRFKTPEREKQKLLGRFNQLVFQDFQTHVSKFRCILYRSIC
jgi:hypothetical protein